MARECLNECLELDEASDSQTAHALQSIAEIELFSGEIAAAYGASLACKALSMRVEQTNKAAIADSSGVLRPHRRRVGRHRDSSDSSLSRAESLRSVGGSKQQRISTERFDTNVDVLKAELGDEDFAKSWSEGTDLTLAEVLDEAEALLEDIEPEDDVLEDEDEE